MHRVGLTRHKQSNLNIHISSKVYNLEINAFEAIKSYKNKQHNDVSELKFERFCCTSTKYRKLSIETWRLLNTFKDNGVILSVKMGKK